MAIKNFTDLMAEAKKVGPKMVAVAAPHEPEILLAAQDAEREGIANCTLVGDRELIRRLAAEHGIDITKMMIIQEP
ncbi:MAG: phosphate acyltransferase, partial [Anaerolineae bacterium]